MELSKTIVYKSPLPKLISKLKSKPTSFHIKNKEKLGTSPKKSILEISPELIINSLNKTSSKRSVRFNADPVSDVYNINKREKVHKSIIKPPNINANKSELPKPEPTKTEPIKKTEIKNEIVKIKKLESVNHEPLKMSKEMPIISIVLPEKKNNVNMKEEIKEPIKEVKIKITKEPVKEPIKEPVKEPVKELKKEQVGGEFKKELDEINEVVQKTVEKKIDRIGGDRKSPKKRSLDTQSINSQPNFFIKSPKKEIDKRTVKSPRRESIKKFRKIKVSFNLDNYKIHKKLFYNPPNKNTKKFLKMPIELKIPIYALLNSQLNIKDI